ncbi:MAG: GntP family permease [Tannerella sp.]|jgi:Gnt-I system low-affinity gluconate transporter|nr:GntP family permease [Tannerella sp.]
MSNIELILILVASIGLLLFMILRFKIQAFLALLVTSIFLGLVTGMPMGSIINSVLEGMGSTLGFVATVVGIGAIFGQILDSSGGAESLALYLTKRFGKDKADYALVIAGFLVGIPIFLDVAFIILVPMLYALAKKSNKSLLYFAIPLLAGLAVTHAFVPPTPGPIATAEIIGVDLGWVALFGLIIGFPVAILAGPVFGKFISKKIHIEVPRTFDMPDENKIVKDLPSFGLVLTIIAVPLVLILTNTVSGLWATAHDMKEHWVIQLLAFLGHPIMALLIATFIAIYAIGIKRGFTKDAILQLSTKSLAPAGLIILITGAGGVFKQLLIDSGLGVQLAESMANSAMPPIVLAYLLAVIIRISQGSATVAMITSAGIMSPLLMSFSLSQPQLALVVIAIASGATTASHVNDSGFWLVSKYLGMNEKQTLQSWTVMETIISVAGFGLALLLSLFI